LLYTKDYEVGRQTCDLLKKALFDCYEEFQVQDVRTEDEQMTAVQALFWGCERQVRMWSAYHEQPWKQFAAPLYRAMRECCEFLRSRYEEHELAEARDIDHEDGKAFAKFDGELSILLTSSFRS